VSRQNVTTDFLAWARISARLLRRPIADRLRIMRDSGVASVWNDADAHWFEVMLEDLRAGQLERVQQYTSLCAEALRQGETLPSPCEELRRRTGAFGGARGRGTQPMAEMAGDHFPAFVQKLGSGPPPAPPDPGQSTTKVFLDAARNDALTTSMALDWPLSTYTWLCAELAHMPERAREIWEARGITTPGAQRAVLELWRERLRDDAQLNARHDELLGRYLDSLRSRT